MRQNLHLMCYIHLEGGKEGGREGKEGGEKKERDADSPVSEATVGGGGRGYST